MSMSSRPTCGGQQGEAWRGRKAGAQAPGSWGRLAAATASPASPADAPGGAPPGRGPPAQRPAAPQRCSCRRRPCRRARAGRGGRGPGAPRWRRGRGRAPWARSRTPPGWGTPRTPPPCPPPRSACRGSLRAREGGGEAAVGRARRQRAAAGGGGGERRQCGGARSVSPAAPTSASWKCPQSSGGRAGRVEAGGAEHSAPRLCARPGASAPIPAIAPAPPAPWRGGGRTFGGPRGRRARHGGRHSLSALWGRRRDAQTRVIGRAGAGRAGLRRE